MAKTDWGYGEGKAPKWRERERIPMNGNPQRKLPDDQVKAIRKEYRLAGGKRGTLTQMAKKHDIDVRVIWDIVNRRTYVDVGGY